MPWVFVFILAAAFPVIAQEPQPSPATAELATAQGEQRPDQQSPGRITGTVVDTSGAVVVGAHIILATPDGTELQNGISGENGEFSFTGVRPGPFQIRATAPGFALQVSSGTLGAGEFCILPAIALPLANINTEVQVSGSRLQVEVAEAQIQQLEKQRILGVVPNYYVSYVPDAVPLTSRQKLRLAWRATIDPVTFALSGVTAAIEQAQNAYSGYGQGAQGYAKRFGADYAYTSTSTLIGNALLPALLKQDPRYFYKGTGSTRSRILYAVANSVICRGDNQRWQPNYSAILGGLAAGGISNLYYPPKERGAALVFEGTAIGTATTAVVNLLQEFVVKNLTPHVSHSRP